MATKQKKQKQPAQVVDTSVEDAALAARFAYRETLVAALQERWKARGLGSSGAVMVPASWATGREQRARIGLDCFLRMDHIHTGVSKTETAQALLDGSNQSAAFDSFLQSSEASLIALSVL